MARNMREAGISFTFCDLFFLSAFDLKVLSLNLTVEKQFYLKKGKGGG
jgi:hypothetical protein